MCARIFAAAVVVIVCVVWSGAAGEGRGGGRDERGGGMWGGVRVGGLIGMRVAAGAGGAVGVGGAVVLAGQGTSLDGGGGEERFEQAVKRIVMCGLCAWICAVGV